MSESCLWLKESPEVTMRPIPGGLRFGALIACAALTSEKQERKLADAFQFQPT